MPVPLAVILPSLIQAAGGIGQHFANRNAINRQNRYNSPVEQVARLREAGLPLSSLDGTAQAGNQSGLPGGEGIAEAGQNLGNFMQTAVQKKQLELMDAQIKAVGAQAAHSAASAQGVEIDNQNKLVDPFAGEPISYVQRKQRLELETAQIQKDINSNRYEIEKIDKLVKESLYKDGTITGTARTALSNMVAELTSRYQSINRASIEDTLIRELMKGGISTGEAFLHAIMTGVMGIRNITH